MAAIPPRPLWRSNVFLSVLDMFTLIADQFIRFPLPVSHLIIWQNRSLGISTSWPSCLPESHFYLGRPHPHTRWRQWLWLSPSSSSASLLLFPLSPSPHACPDYPSLQALKSSSACCLYVFPSGSPVPSLNHLQSHHDCSVRNQGQSQGLSKEMLISRVPLPPLASCAQLPSLALWFSVIRPVVFPHAVLWGSKAICLQKRCLFPRSRVLWNLVSWVRK